MPITRKPYTLVCQWLESPNPSALWYHDKSVHEGVAYNCNICQSTFTKKHNLSIHIKSVHFKETYHQCKICDYQATQRAHLSKHVKNVHQKSENIECSECNQFIQKNNLKRHMEIFHLGEQKLYNCKVCTFQSRHQVAVSKHVKNIHQKF